MSKHNGVASKSLVQKLRRLFSNQSGQVALTTGLAAVPLFMIAAAGIEMQRYNSDKTHFQVAVDSAALAVARDPEADKASPDYEKLKTVAYNYIHTNFPTATDITQQSISVNVTSTTVTLGVTHNHANAFSGFLGKSSVPMVASTEVKKGGSKIEVVLVMDVTGSMSGSMTSAKTAAKNLLTNLYGDTTTMSDTKIRVAVVPFSAAVRLNVTPKKDSGGNIVKDTNGNVVYANDFDPSWIDTTGANPLSTLHFRNPTDDSTVSGWSNYQAYAKLGLSWNGCVEARAAAVGANPVNYITSDLPPSASDPYSLFPAYFAPDMPDDNSAWGKSTSNYVGGDTSGVSMVQPDIPQEYSCNNWGWSCGYSDKAFNSANWNALTTSQKNSWFTYWGKLTNNYKKYENAPKGDARQSDVESGCPSSSSVVMPLTYSRTNAISAIDALAANGNTNIPEGLAWGWHVISPGAPFTKVAGVGSIPEDTIAPYGDQAWRKVIVLMTDGDNTTSNGFSYVGSLYDAYGFGLDPMNYNRFGNTNTSGATANQWDEDTWTAKMDDNMSNSALPGLCKGIKDTGTQIYTVAFNMPKGSSPTKSLLQGCSSDTAANYFDASNSTELNAAFSAIGQQLRETILYVAR